MTDWIWLDSEKFPEYSLENRSFYMAEFLNAISASQSKKITIKICADARYMLYVNGEFVGRGPSSAGGDFLWPKMRFFYYDEYVLDASKKLEIRVLASSVPSVLCESSAGQSGLYFEALGENGASIALDGKWLCRPVSSFLSVTEIDYTKKEYSFEEAMIVPNVYKLKKSPLEPLCERTITPISLDKITLNKNTGVAIFDKIYSAYPEISIKADGRVKIQIEYAERQGQVSLVEQIITDHDIVFTSPRLRSVGEIKITLDGEGARSAKIENVKIIYSAYPVKNKTTFNCSDTLLNQIYELCMHTLKICRRDIHLDSPMHQEHLACTGDYYIQALMEYMNIYDPTLTAFDIYRTSELLDIQDGRLFHTTYSLIFPEWLLDYYMHTADKKLLVECKTALNKLLRRFDGYIYENGLVECAPDYMFVDWILMDENGNHTDPTNMMSHGNFEGFSLHHPPKALGQGVLCMFYYNALCKSARLFEILDEPKSAKECQEKAQKLKEAINIHLFDGERGLYLGGLNTPDMVENSEWLPKNTNKKFYLKQANTLAVLFGIAPKGKAREILEYVVTDLKKEEMQPYFYHFLLLALLKENMFAEHGMALIRRYESILEKCDKGLCEAWEMFPSDSSHAWGGTPAYILKLALSGFEMIEAGYKRVKLSPRIYDLDFADFGISTPYGAIEIKLENGQITVTAPDQIQIEMEK